MKVRHIETDSLPMQTHPRAVVIVERVKPMVDASVYGGVSHTNVIERVPWFFTGRTKVAERVGGVDNWRTIDAAISGSELAAIGPQNQVRIAEYAPDGDPDSMTRWYTWDGEAVEIL